MNYFAFRKPDNSKKIVIPEPDNDKENVPPSLNGQNSGVRLIYIITVLFSYF